MLPDNDEEWLRGVAFGVADGTVEVNSPPPPPSPPHQGEPLVAQPLQQVTDGVQVEAVTVGRNTVHLDDSEVEEVQLDTGGRQKGIADSDALPLRKDKKRSHVGEAEGEKTSKKRKSKSKSSSHKSGSSSHYRSFALDEEFAKKTYEEYMANPLAAAVHTMLHLRDLAEEERKKSELQVKEVQAERESALAELRLAKDQLKMAILSLVTLRSTLKLVEKAVAQDKVVKLEEKIKELEKSEHDSNLEVQRLASKVSELGEALRNAPAPAECSDTHARVAELEKELKAKDAMLARSEEKAKKTTQLAFQMKDKYFNLALKQVMVVNPAMDRLQTVFKHDYIVEDGKIVQVDPATKAKSIVYPSV